MDLQSNLIESMKQKQKGGWKASVASVVVHGGLIAGIIVLSASASHKVNAEDKPIRAFITHEAAPPPPPPPPPPAASSSAPKATTVKPVEVPKQTFVQPRDIPKDVPKVDPTPVADTTPSSDNAAPSDGGVAGGVPGGVPGGVVGGQIGGVVGGQIGGVVGGVIGGQVGGTGTTEPAAPPKTDGPLRVGGDVKAPVVTHRVDPLYPEMARKGRVAGVVIIEAIIDKNGEVQDAKVLKGLPMGLSDAAVEAVKQWHFKPGTMNGEPVEVIFDLTVNFKVD